ncbi:calcium-binding protein [Aliigemmobacter aestuarii]|nr:calcium-binding protein [Gemmobacter aestuarii]
MSDDLYRITITNGTVTRVEEYDDGVWEWEPIEADETYTVNPDGTITKVDVERGYIERVTLTPTDDPGIYLEGIEEYILPDGTITRVEPDDDRGGRGGRGFDDRFGSDDDDDISCGDGRDHARGGRGRDSIDGQRGDDSIEGGAGSDSIEGGAGADTCAGNAGNDRVWGQWGDDSMVGGRGWDVLLGGAGDDVLSGGNGRDRIFGGEGNDTITGGNGRDRLDGGDGADHFVFAPGAGRDRIVDFEDGLDLIVFTGGVQSFDDLTIRQRGDDVRVFHSGGFIEVKDVQASDLTADDFLFA